MPQILLYGFKYTHDVMIFGACGYSNEKDAPISVLARKGRGKTGLQMEI
jgi:hypothetical protein